MPPKQRQPSVSSSHGRSFNIASFFDAASASRRTPQRPSGHGFRIDRPSPSQDVGASPSQRGLTSSSHLSSATAGGTYHWSSGLANTAELTGDAAGDSPAESGYSTTMQAVRARLLSELDTDVRKEGKDKGGSSASSLSAKLQQHRKRALAIAFGGEDDLMVSAVEFALTCPYSRLPLRVPVRSRLCNHVQCCDLDSWMVLMDKHKSLRDPKGPCPVCEQRVAASTLEVDVWMLHVLEQMPTGTHLVVLDADGSYHSGDTTREKRREEITMEVIDATQGDFENFLGDVVDDDDDDGEVVQAMSAPGHTHNTHAGAKRPREEENTAPPAAADARAALIASGVPGGPTIIVKQEPNTVREEPHEVPVSPDHASAPPELSQAPPTPTQDDGVVVVHFIEPTAHGRAMPSRIREWVFYCPECQTAQLKGETGLEQTTPHTQASSSSTPALPDATERCTHCGHTTRDQWSLVRRFGGAQGVTMELAADGTLVMRGVDAASPYLYRAGFVRTRFAPQEFQHPPPPGFQPEVGVWVTTGLLSRFELDFLEACCERLAAGETELESFDGMMVPSLFRIPRRRRTGPGGHSVATTQRH